jgi:hypothetical protein
LSPPAAVDKEKQNVGEREVDPDVVVMARAYKEDDLDDAMDYKYRTMALFLPQCGVFYCARERRHEDVGLVNTLIPLDMSWLRLRRDKGSNGSVSYNFGNDGYVKRFHRQYSSDVILEHNQISAWRISTQRRKEGRSNRLMCRAIQCHDKDGPMMAPDVFSGEDAIGWPHEYLALEYNRRLALAKSAKKHGRHYANGCHHYRLPDTCWMIDPAVSHCVDIMVDVATVGQCANRQSVVMIRNVLLMDTEDDDADQQLEVHLIPDDDERERLEALSHITAHNTLLQKRVESGSARAKSGDVGTMHAIGTRVNFDNVTTLPYQTNSQVTDRVLRNMVAGLWKVGSHCFPQVLAVIRDLESDSGLKPVPPMDGDGDKGRRVGYTIDMSVNLGNASHYDVHDASQGFSVWTEEIRGLGSNWFFVMPNLHGKRPDGRPFCGIAIKLGYGTAISWDGRVIRHATSLSKPDGIDSMRLGDAGYRPRNHLFGTFTAAKERVIKAGRALCKATATASGKLAVASSDKSTVAAATKNAPKKERRKRKKRLRMESKAHGAGAFPTVKLLPHAPRNNNSNALCVSPTLRDINTRETSTLQTNNHNDKKHNEEHVSPSRRNDKKQNKEHVSPSRRDNMNNVASLDNRIPRKKPRTA